MEGYSKAGVVCKNFQLWELKRMAYDLQYVDGRFYIKPEKIIKPVVVNIPNRFKNDTLTFLRTTITIHRKVYNFSIARLVYHCFIKPFDMQDDSIIILTKNSKGLDIKLSDLKLASQREKQKRILY